MNNFEYKNPTKIIFGQNKIAELATEIPTNAKILMLYGGGSIKSNGIYDQVKTALADFEVLEFSGIPSNPEYSILMNALDFIKSNEITYLLAVGGGSVIDGTKFLSAAAFHEGETPWDLLTSRKPVLKAMPFAAVLTLPATGSEMNSGAVVTRRETKEKLAMSGPALFPQFSILDPQVIKSIPERQIANGLADAFTHVLEQYLTYPTDALLQDRFAEGILQTLIEVSPKILKDPSDYNAGANFMWSCTMALNGLISQGVPSDWAVHAMGHELTALFGIDHARTLAIIAPSHYKYNLASKKEKLAQFAERVFNISEGSTEEKALAGIDATEAFFHTLGIKTKLSEYTEDYTGTAELISKRFTDRGWMGIGERGSLSPTDVAKIIEMAY
ncbi:iron-containing alcohol dehydrogenase [Ancylomarina sp. 16SWW S1-10-2]|uniref:iron-containing alcohol dehydrogenase n=1 Tax=Ancylomarina sp. 16SWW S1-10-2 TaxID=2499681 RepID=UPI0012ADAE6E|nr:iron-containing alcohol dehydrogenase [Ancylomarina sp. 16SWW S1-10-2]MRT92953.1 iron-containing alcohol dehydrogenase [Ancylomarina sp. 16SWW S1-10-2]